MNWLTFFTLGLIQPKIDPLKDEYYRPMPIKKADVYVNGKVSNVDYRKHKPIRQEYRPDYTYSS